MNNRTAQIWFDHLDELERQYAFETKVFNWVFNGCFIMVAGMFIFVIYKAVTT